MKDGQDLTCLAVLLCLPLSSSDMPVTTYSGGWKVKMQLCAATLMDADILMLDEPTGHLDVANIAWIKNWLRSFLAKGGSIMATSHDSEFLEEMCTHIIDFQKKKLVMFRGNLKDFVVQNPEKEVSEGVRAPVDSDGGGRGGSTASVSQALQS